MLVLINVSEIRNDMTITFTSIDTDHHAIYRYSQMPLIYLLNPPALNLWATRALSFPFPDEPTKLLSSLALIMGSILPIPKPKTQTQTQIEPSCPRNKNRKLKIENRE